MFLEDKKVPAWVLIKQAIQQTPEEELIFTSLEGVDGVSDGKLPSGETYEWRKRRP